MIDEGVDYCGDECHNYWAERARAAEARIAAALDEYDNWDGADGTGAAAQVADVMFRALTGGDE